MHLSRRHRLPVRRWRAGPYESILGRQIERAMKTTLSFMPTAFDVATGDVRLSGTIVEVDPTTGKATGIRRLVVREAEVFNGTGVKNSDSHPL